MCGGAFGLHGALCDSNQNMKGNVRCAKQCQSEWCFIKQCHLDLAFGATQLKIAGVMSIYSVNSDYSSFPDNSCNYYWICVRTFE